MSTSDQQDTPQLTRRQLRELRETGATPIVTPEMAEAAMQPAEESAVVAESVAQVEGQPVEIPEPEIGPDGEPLLTRRQLRELSRTAEIAALAQETAAPEEIDEPEAVEAPAPSPVRAVLSFLKRKRVEDEPEEADEPAADEADESDAADEEPSAAAGDEPAVEDEADPSGASDVVAETAAETNAFAGELFGARETPGEESAAEEGVAAGLPGAVTDLFGPVADDAAEAPGALGEQAEHLAEQLGLTDDTDADDAESTGDLDADDPEDAEPEDAEPEDAEPEDAEPEDAEPEDESHDVADDASDAVGSDVDVDADADAADEANEADEVDTADTDDTDGDEADASDTAEPVRAEVAADFGASVFADRPASDTLRPSFDELVGSADSAGSPHAAPASLIYTQPNGEPSLSGPIDATGDLLVTGSYEFPSTLGSHGHAPGTTDGKDIDASLVDSELAPASSPIPVAASSAISTLKPAGEVIRQPAPEKGGKLLMGLAITAGGLMIALTVALVVAFTNGVF